MSLGLPDAKEAKKMNLKVETIAGMTEAIQWAAAKAQSCRADEEEETKNSAEKGTLSDLGLGLWFRIWVAFDSVLDLGVEL